ncbi:MAG TPA: hypothetical protein VIV12_26430 [Streptosporangiaceae bacterium]|jgi:hypothetical protein
MCACNGSSSTAKKTTYVYTDAKGTSKVYKTEIEAQAARIRAGGAGSVRVQTA